MLYLATLIPLAILDAIWLFSTGSFYREKLGHLFADKFSFGPAVLFYLVYAAAVAYFVLQPNLASSYLKIFLVGAFFGFAVYAAYDFTNQATMRSWPVIVTIVDLAWGAILTGITAMAALAITNFFK